MWAVRRAHNPLYGTTLRLKYDQKSHHPPPPTGCHPYLSDHLAKSEHDGDDAATATTRQTTTNYDRRGTADGQARHDGGGEVRQTSNLELSRLDSIMVDAVGTPSYAVHDLGDGEVMRLAGGFPIEGLKRSAQVSKPSLS